MVVVEETPIDVVGNEAERVDEIGAIFFVGNDVNEADEDDHPAVKFAGG